MRISCACIAIGGFDRVAFENFPVSHDGLLPACGPIISNPDRSPCCLRRTGAVSRDHGHEAALARPLGEDSPLAHRSFGRVWSFRWMPLTRRTATVARTHALGCGNPFPGRGTSYDVGDGALERRGERGRSRV